jgi:ABC-type nitrate/sulfonate/bicarbonate transport system substrate-binding protein
MLKLTTALMIAIVGWISTATDVAAQDKVRFIYPVQIHTASMAVLAEYAAKRGVALEVTQMRRYADIQLALTTNQADVVVLGYVNLGLMEEKGFRNHKVVSGVFTGGQSLTLRTGVTVDSWKALEGKTLGTAPNSYAELLFKSTAKLAGADVSKIKTISFASAGPPALAALRSGEIDGFVFWEPNNAEAALAGIGTYSKLDIGDNPTKHINGAIVVNSEFAAKNRKAVLGIVQAVVDSTNALNADQARYAEVARKETGSSPEVVKMAIPHGTLDYKLYQKETAALLKMIYDAGITKIDASPVANHMLDYSFLMEATGKSQRDLGGE